MAVWRDIDDGPPHELRSARLDALAHPQELYLEQRVSTGRTMVLSGVSGSVAGYAVIADDAVVEFHVDDDTPSDDAFGSLLRATDAKRSMMMSFDATGLRSARSHATGERSIGTLFRAFAPSDTTLGDITTRHATQTDQDRVAAMHDSFFDDLTEIDHYIRTRTLVLFELGKDLLGCGITTRVIAGREAVDIGMVVAVDERGRGHGTDIAAHLAKQSVDAGDRPIAGCAVSNEASHRALERAGFRSDHTLIELEH